MHAGVSEHRAAGAQRGHFASVAQRDRGAAAALIPYRTDGRDKRGWTRVPRQCRCNRSRCRPGSRLVGCCAKTEYPNADAPGGFGTSAVGGRVYRGSALPLFVGRYLFVDFSRGFLPPGDASLFMGTRLDPAGES